MRPAHLVFSLRILLPGVVKEKKNTAKKYCAVSHFQTFCIVAESVHQFGREAASWVRVPVSQDKAATRPQARAPRSAGWCRPHRACVGQGAALCSRPWEGVGLLPSAHPVVWEV